MARLWFPSHKLFGSQEKIGLVRGNLIKGVAPGHKSKGNKVDSVRDYQMLNSVCFAIQAGTEENAQQQRDKPRDGDSKRERRQLQTTHTPNETSDSRNGKLVLATSSRETCVYTRLDCWFSPRWHHFTNRDAISLHSSLLLYISIHFFPSAPCSNFLIGISFLILKFRKHSVLIKRQLLLICM